METEAVTYPAGVVLRVRGPMRLWGQPDAETRLLELLRSNVSDQTTELILNLAGVANIDTMGISALVRVLIECTKRHIRLKVILPSGVAGESVRRVRIFEAWPAYSDEESAAQGAARV